MKLYRKVYGVFGMVEWSTLIPMGNGNIRIDFSNGSMTERGIDPATFSTENHVVQIAIEESAKFKNNKIKLMKAYEIGEIVDPVLEVAPAKVAPVKVKAPKDKDTEGGEGSGGGEKGGNDAAGSEAGAGGSSEGSNKIFPDVKNSQQAKDILLGGPFNVALAELGNKTAILTKSEGLGVSFPNWK